MLVPMNSRKISSKHICGVGEIPTFLSLCPASSITPHFSDLALTDGGQVGEMQPSEDLRSNHPSLVGFPGQRICVAVTDDFGNLSKADS